MRESLLFPVLAIMAEKHDYYEMLGVPRDAKLNDIKKAFRNLAREHHPDVNAGDKDSEARFKEFNEAYQVLSDPRRKSTTATATRDLIRHSAAEGYGDSGDAGS